MEEITVLEYEADPQEEHQEVQQPEAPGEGEPVGEQLPECLDHQPSTFMKGKPRSILSLLCFQTINLSPFYVDALSTRSWLEPLAACIFLV